MAPKVYLETTIPSYLTALPSRDLVVAAHQQITREWWQGRERFELFISQIVLREASGGDAEAASRRMELVQGISVLEVTDEASVLAEELVRRGALPESAAVDALHISVAVVNGLDYILTWNCTHIANATIRGDIERICRSKEYEPPAICTPEELMEG